tara:strand:+ start:2452 stop:2742 length:291 start_codon:yes stop_codon:yes gene_type:complete
MSKFSQPKVYIDLVKDNYVLTRINDNKQIAGSVVKFVEWNENGTAKSLHDQPAIGRSVTLDLTGPESYRWMTTEIVEIISDTEFKTKNSTYTLHKL